MQTIFPVHHQLKTKHLFFAIISINIKLFVYCKAYNYDDWFESLTSLLQVNSLRFSEKNCKALCENSPKIKVSFQFFCF